MRITNDFDRQPWLLKTINPKVAASLHRWNLALVSILAVLVLGAFALILMTLMSQSGHAASRSVGVPLKIDGNPAPVSLTDLKNGYSAVIGPALRRW